MTSAHKPDEKSPRHDDDNDGQECLYDPFQPADEFGGAEFFKNKGYAHVVTENRTRLKTHFAGKQPMNIPKR